MVGSGSIHLPTISHIRQAVMLQDSPCKRIIWIAPGWPNIPWFWDPVAMSGQIQLSLPILLNLLTQPFNQIPHRNLTIINLDARLLEPQHLRSRAWDPVAMSSQIPLSLPILLNLLTQPFNQIPHRNLTIINLDARLPEPQHSRSRASLRRWQQKLRLLTGDQPDQSMRQSGPFYKWCVTN